MPAFSEPEITLRVKSLLTPTLVGVMAASLFATPASATTSTPGSAETETGRVQVSASCYTRNTDLYCDNRPGTPLRVNRSYESPVRDYLDTSHSWFQCWGYGDWHAGGNNVWYWTQGDRYGAWGNIAAVDVYTSVDPPAGINQC
ncbi:hypothetical protein Q8791_30550 [Nocardiopsis sp. CT-R113]|uniref:Secreted protein n=1 Tax=Nocardiopsis codii TaxID=3065942 RepID=A0ABU7KH57_9ACTN|nr:hypothetical protein [Nocardiopsis sp. CT-R113]MEE2041571.1 hypothetical protein [Nocardiopsis sp. CT-R113]